MFLEKYAELKVELNAETKNGKTFVHCACNWGQSNVANALLMIKSTDLKIDLNARDSYGYTAFHYACSRGWSEIVDMMIKVPLILLCRIISVECPTNLNTRWPDVTSN